MISIALSPGNVSLKQLQLSGNDDIEFNNGAKLQTSL